MSKKLLKEISGMLTNVVGEEKGKQIFEANFTKPKGLDCYMPGKILTWAELKALPEDTVIHIKYLDEDGEVSEDDFHHLGKDDEMREWNAGGSFPFPVYELKDEDLIENIDNCGHSFTIREAVPGKKGEWRKVRKQIEKSQDLTQQLISLHHEYQRCTDKVKKKAIKKKSAELEKKWRKITGM